MNYEKNYYDYLSYIKSLHRVKLNTSAFDYVYYEYHHIIPKCVGGTDEDFNLVLLTAREHFLAHYLLCKIYDTGINHSKMIFAFNGMKRNNNGYRNYFNSRLYEASRIEFRNLVSSIMSNRTFVMMYNKEVDTIKHCKTEQQIQKYLELGYLFGGRPPKEESIKKMKETKLNQNLIPWNKGLKMSKDYKIETDKKSKETRNKNGTLTTHKGGYLHSKEAKDKIAKKATGRKHTKEQNEKHSNLMKKRKWFTEISTGKSFMLEEEFVDFSKFVKGRHLH